MKSVSERDPNVKAMYTKKKRQFQTNTLDDEESAHLPMQEMQNMLFQALAKFIRTVPPKSKQIIWKHALQTDPKNNEDDQKVCTSTTSAAHVAKLLGVCTTVYVKVFVH